MRRFEITITYSKVIEAYDEDDASRIVADTAANSNLVGEYAPFNDMQVYTEVEEVKSDD